MSDRNEWFKDVKRLARNLEVETVEDPFAWPTVTSVTDGEDVLYAPGLHMCSKRFETIWQAKEYLKEAGFEGECGLLFRNFRTNSDAQIVRPTDAMPRVYETACFWLSRIETPDRLINAHIRIFENEISGEFFAFNGSILVGPCESAERVARECNCFIRMREVNSYNARKSGGSDGE